MKTFIQSKSKKNQEHFGEEFSVLNSTRYNIHSTSKTLKSDIYTAPLYILSIISIVSWIISLKIFPFGHLFQFLLGALVLTVNFLIFRWAKS